MVLRRLLSSAERDALQPIEQLRRNIISSSVVISTVDYGAGDEDRDLTSNEMAQGRNRIERLSELCQTRSKAPAQATVLFRIVRFVRPLRCLELGTCLGLSAAYIGAALKLNGAGHLTSLEGCPNLAQLAKRNVALLNFQNTTIRSGRFQDVLPEELTHGRFEFVFIDGHHDHDATMCYFNQIASAGQTVVVLDDIRWSAGMARAWSEIAKSRLTVGYATVQGFGVCLTTASVQTGYLHPLK